MKLSRWWAPVVVVVVMLLAAPVGQLAGWWSTSGREQVVAQQLSVDDLKGWMTLQQAADGLGVPAQTLIDALGPEASGLAPSTAFKDVEAAVSGFELSTFRDQLRELLANSTTPTAPSATPE
jgi:hypothetical protein